MSNNNAAIAKLFLDLSQVADSVLYPTARSRALAANQKLGAGQRALLERIDGFRSIDQLLSMSGDVVGVHATLGKWLAEGVVTTDAADVGEQPVAVRVAAGAAEPAAARSGELESAKRLLMLEAKLLLGAGAGRLTPRIAACESIEQVYDLIVKFQEHLAKTGKADPDVFLDRLSKGLAAVRSQPAARVRASS